MPRERSRKPTIHGSQLKPAQRADIISTERIKAKPSKRKANCEISGAQLPDKKSKKEAKQARRSGGSTKTFNWESTKEFEQAKQADKMLQFLELPTNSWLTQGHFASKKMQDHCSATGQTRPKHAAAIAFPPPLGLGMALLNSVTPFQLPYRVYHRELVNRAELLKTTQRPSSFKILKKNLYTQDNFTKPKKEDLKYTCNCQYIAGVASSACGENCFNRVGMYECVRSMCPVSAATNSPCLNQRLQQGLAAPTRVAYMGSKGWGLVI
jgi:hypothetical protein